MVKKTGANLKKKKNSVKVRNLTGYSCWREYCSAFEAYTSPSDISAPSFQNLRWDGWQIQSGGLEDCSLRRLFILEPRDLLEFTSEDIVQAWTYRNEVCGSLVAAAELYALKRVLSGEDESYVNSKNYLSHPEVLSIFEPEPVRAETPLTGYQADVVDKTSDLETTYLTLVDVRLLSSSELLRAWEARPESFASLEAAAEALSSLRWLSSGSAEKTSYTHFLSHPLIQELEDQLPRELPMALPYLMSEREVELLKEDRRAVRSQLAVIRTGQRDFRSALLERYGAVCCVTGCEIERLIEAAHIIPYRGAQTNDQDNGLLLRVDIHRLFDEYLVSIEPEKLFFIVSESIDDPTYKSLHERKLFQLTPKPRRMYIEAHFRRFQKEENQRINQKATPK